MLLGIKDMRGTNYLLKRDAWNILVLGLLAPSRNAREKSEIVGGGERDNDIVEANKYSKYLLEKIVWFI